MRWRCGARGRCSAGRCGRGGSSGRWWRSVRAAGGFPPECCPGELGESMHCLNRLTWRRCCDRGVCTPAGGEGTVRGRWGDPDRVNRVRRAVAATGQAAGEKRTGRGRSGLGHLKFPYVKAGWGRVLDAGRGRPEQPRNPPPSARRPLPLSAAAPDPGTPSRPAPRRRRGEPVQRHRRRHRAKASGLRAGAIGPCAQVTGPCRGCAAGSAQPGGRGSYRAARLSAAAAATHRNPSRERPLPQRDDAAEAPRAAQWVNCGPRATRRAQGVTRLRRSPVVPSRDPTDGDHVATAMP